MAADDLGGISKKGSMPWPKNSSDLKWFKTKTINSIVVMGRLTWIDPFMPAPLKGRVNVLITNQGKEKYLGADEYLSGNILERVSSLYESLAISNMKQPKFLNIALKIISELDSLELLKIAKRIESDFGRNLVEVNKPRIIDIDIILMKSMGNHVMVDLQEHNGLLQIPHPRAHLRAFVLMPLIEIEPELTHPILNKTLKEILIDLDKQDIDKLNSISY